MTRERRKRSRASTEIGDPSENDISLVLFGFISIRRATRRRIAETNRTSVIVDTSHVHVHSGASGTSIFSDVTVPQRSRTDDFVTHGLRSCSNSFRAWDTCSTLRGCN
ncbi:hypothetical protein KM043_008305 [Ampulex compressa]|nr:hypothetical protein KM043_008305 [Ampulex compressa]